MIANQKKLIQWMVLFFAELAGTAILLFIGCMGCVDNFEHFHPTHLTICLGFGFAVMIAINTYGCVSGAHINPCVTITALIYKAMDIPVSILSSILINFLIILMKFLNDIHHPHRLRYSTSLDKCWEHFWATH